jgi:hypothetical protein
MLLMILCYSYTFYQIRLNIITKCLIINSGIIFCREIKSEINLFKNDKITINLAESFDITQYHFA